MSDKPDTTVRSSPLFLTAAWLIVVIPAAWGLEHTVQSALKLFHTPAAVTQPAPAR